MSFLGPDSSRHCVGTTETPDADPRSHMEGGQIKNHTSLFSLIWNTEYNPLCFRVYDMS